MPAQMGLEMDVPPKPDQEAGSVPQEAVEPSAL